MTDATDLIRQARMHQAAILEHRTQEAGHQRERDRLIHQLRASDVEQWSYAKIAEAVGLTSPNVVKILRKPAPEYLPHLGRLGGAATKE